MTATAELGGDYDVRIKRYAATDPRLGRHVRHDSRNRFYAYAGDTAAIASVRHDVHVPILDQGQIGSCTGNSGTENMASGDFWSAVSSLLSTTDSTADETYAKALYFDAEKLDGGAGLPSEDQGSTGPTIAKVLQARGLIAGYQHAFDQTAILTALSRQVVMFGMEWTENMFTPTSAGELVPTGKVAGGHELSGDELDVENGRVWLRNHWTASWGVGGRAWLSLDALADRMGNNGDCTILTPLTQPAPTPTPTPVPSAKDAAAADLRKYAQLASCPRHVARDIAVLAGA